MPIFSPGLEIGIGRICTCSKDGSCASQRYRLANELQMVLRSFPISDGDKIPAPGFIAHQRETASLTETTDSKQWRRSAGAVTSADRSVSLQRCGLGSRR